MFRLALVALAALASISCSEVPSAPGTGGVGGAGGAGGGGVGGQGGDGVDPCAVVVPAEYDDLEPTDIVQKGAALGQVSGVCPGVPCDGDDPIDRWSITTCGGEHEIKLSWDDEMHNLNLFVYTPDDADSWSSQGQNSTVEVISEELTADQEYIIQVQAADTGNDAQAYDIFVTRTE